MNVVFAWMTALLLACGPSLAVALSAEQARAITAGDSEERLAAIRAASSQGDADTLRFLTELLEGNVRISPEQVFIVNGATVVDAVTGSAAKLPDTAEEVINNNRMRREIEAAIAGARLASPEPNDRIAAIKQLQDENDPERLPLLRNALARETDARVRGLLNALLAALQLSSEDRDERLAAARSLGESGSPATKTLMLARLQRDGDRLVEPDPAVRAQLELSLRKIEDRLAWGERLGTVFAGLSLGSILLLAALGLAITYGLMGVINMAHGELMMVGAYATYLVQNLFKTLSPAWFDAYLIAALPVAFISAALVGIALERIVIRRLYGRPLETLLATWGISLMLIQAVRSIFGAQNVQVENPAWMSGGIQVMSNLVLPYNRIMIIGFALLVLAAMAAVLSKTRLGLYVRGVTQNRTMAGCVGVPTARVDTLAFGLGSGVAGLAGAALSQVGNVGPDLGQSYIVDSFMVVVLGGVGQLAGAVIAGLGLGVVNKLLEGMTGPVLAKIAVLVFIIIFIQKRPSGLFALKGRSAES